MKPASHRRLRAGCRRLGWSWLATSLLLVGCDRSADRLAAEEITGELRALRAAMPRSQVSGADIAVALAPLRDAVQSLAARQSELTERQQQLAQELTRCVGLVAGTAGIEGAKAEAEELRQRLAVLERELAAQLQARSQAEAALQHAVDSAAERLERALQAIAPGGGQAGDSPAGATDPRGSPANQPPAPTPTGKPPAGGGDDGEVGAAAEGVQIGRDGEPIRKGLVELWALVLALLAACGLLWWWRWRRPVTEVVAIPPGMDRGVEEIWAAAELLGEAVGKLRTQAAPAEAASATLPLGAAAAPMPQFAAAPPPPPREVRPSAPQELSTTKQEQAGEGFDPLDLLGLEEPVAAPAAPPSASVAPAAAAPASAGAAAVGLAARPTVVQFVLPLHGKPAAAAVAAVQLALASDGRVLRRPAPECLAAEGRVAVKCWLLPNLPAAERLHVEQRLRSAVA